MARISSPVVNVTDTIHYLHKSEEMLPEKYSEKIVLMFYFLFFIDLIQ